VERIRGTQCFSLLAAESGRLEPVEVAVFCTWPYS